MNALSVRSAIVTNVAIVSVKTRIRRCGFNSPRIRLIMMFAEISTNAVAPAMVRTKFSRPFWNDEGLLKQITAAIPVGRIAEVEDVIGTVLFLASGLADFVTGESVTVDGGSMA